MLNAPRAVPEEYDGKVREVAATHIPRVSVVLPTHDRAYVLWRAIESVLRQTFTAFELIVIDDGSVDCTARLVEEFQDPRMRYHAWPPPARGCAAARNLGLGLCRGSLIAYLDSDNCWHPGYLQQMVAAADADTTGSLFYTGQITTLWERTVQGRWHLISRQPVARRSFDMDDVRDLRWPDINCILHRAGVAEAVGGFDEDLWWLDDWDFFFRVFQRYAEGCVWVPGTLVEYRQVHGEGADGICGSAREQPAQEIAGRRALLAKWGHVLSASALARLACNEAAIHPLRAGK